MRKLATAFIMIIALTAVPLKAGAQDLVTAKIPVTIDLGGDAQIEAVTPGAPMPESSIISVPDGQTDFISIRYSQPDTYEYTIRQTGGEDHYSVYDTTQYSVIVFVTATDTGIMPIVVVVKDGEKTDMVHFKNQNIMSDPTVTKEAMHGGSWEQTVSAKNKDIVNFRLTATIPKDWRFFHPYIFSFVDKLPKGLTYQNDAKVVFSGQGDITDKADITVKDRLLTVMYNDLHNAVSPSKTDEIITLTYSVKVDWDKAGDLRNFAKVQGGDRTSKEVYATVKVKADKNSDKSSSPAKKVIKKAAQAIKTGDARMYMILVLVLILAVFMAKTIADGKRRKKN